MPTPNQIRRAAATAEAASRRLNDAIRQGHRNGMSLRDIAATAGMSHETVRRICSKDLNPADQLNRTDA